jgi:hypothetical protein
VGTGDITPKYKDNELSSIGGFTATVNSMMGCNYTKYYGSFSSSSEWDTHRGNTIVSLRLFIEPDNMESNSPRYIKDVWFKIPDGYVFNNENIRETRFNVSRLFDYVASTKLTGSDFCTEEMVLSDFIHPFNPVTASFLPPWTDHSSSESLFTVDMNLTTECLCIKMNTQALAEGYKESLSTFIIFDHKNSVANRGSNWSGFGFFNPNFTPNPGIPFSQYPAIQGTTLLPPPFYVPSFNYSHVTYPQTNYGTMIFREKLLEKDFTDGEYDKAFGKTTKEHYE